MVDACLSNKDFLKAYSQAMDASKHGHSIDCVARTTMYEGFRWSKAMNDGQTMRVTPRNAGSDCDNRGLGLGSRQIIHTGQHSHYNGALQCEAIDVHLWQGLCVAIKKDHDTLSQAGLGLPTPPTAMITTH